VYDDEEGAQIINEAAQHATIVSDRRWIIIFTEFDGGSFTLMEVKS
jgi:hypothetical protein